MNKKGDINYLLISLILGIAVLGLVLWFIFQEYFTQEDIDWELCRQSIVLRSSIPAERYGDLAKNMYPIKCKTMPWTIKTKNKNEAADYVANISASCFYAFGEGKLEIFGRAEWTADYDCIVCARISIGPEFAQNFKDQNKIPIFEYLKNHNTGDKKYINYLYDNIAGLDSWTGSRDVNSEQFRQDWGIPNYWENPEQDMFITFGSRQAIRGWLGGQATSSFQSGIQFFTVDDLKKKCTKVYSIPA